MSDQPTFKRKAWDGNDRFEPTVEGCAEARKWLDDTGQIHLLQKEQSTDGWTLVALANSLYRERVQ